MIEMKIKYNMLYKMLNALKNKSDKQIEKFQFSEDGLIVETIDDGRIMLCKIYISKEDMESYEFDENLKEVFVNLPNLLHAVKALSLNNKKLNDALVLKLSISEMKITISNSKMRTYSHNMIPYDSGVKTEKLEKIKHPILIYGVKKDLNSFLKSYALHDVYFHFKTAEDLELVMTDILKDKEYKKQGCHLPIIEMDIPKELITTEGDLDYPIQINFNRKYLNSINNKMSLSSIWKFGFEIPLLCETKCGFESYIKFWLAPRIEEEVEVKDE